MKEAKPDPDPVSATAYLSEVTARLEAELGPRLVGVYAGGSYALKDFRTARSDLDVAAVVADRLPGEIASSIVARLRHEALPCPARGLELVVYRLETARDPTAVIDFELNLNTGREMPHRADFGPGSGPDHWFPIDRSILSQAGVALLGPPAGEVFAPIDPETLVPVLLRSVAWHRHEPGMTADAILNACRSLRFACEAIWSSKTGAGEWAIRRGSLAANPVEDALAARRGGVDPDPAPARELLAQVEAELRKLEAGAAALRR
jgi:hypothetical protein